MGSDEDDLFGSSSDGGDTDDLIANAKEKPAPTKKRLQKKAAPNSSLKKRKIPDADKNDDDDDLFADSDDDDKPKDSNKQLSKRERMEALQKKKRQDAAATLKRQQDSKRATTKTPKPSADADKEKGYDSGDSYDSAAFVRTKEDNDFIDMEGEDEDAVRELYAEQHFDDERPDGDDDDDDGPSRKKKKSSGGSKQRGPDYVSDDDKDNPIMEAVNKMKRKKRAAPKLAELEEEAKAFIARMDNAADEDEQSFSAKKPAVKKLAMLTEVIDMLTRRDMIRLLLDFDVLAACKRWIQPLPNGQLGNVTVRQRLIETIGTMTGETGITSNDLKRSGIGQTVMVLYKHSSETPTMKRDLKKLIEQWSRPIFQKSGNMKDLEHVHSTRRPPQGISSIASMRKTPSKPASHADVRAKKDNLQALIASGKTGQQKDSLNRVRVPYSTGFDFTVRPQNKTGEIQDKRIARPGQPQNDTRGNLSKRMTEKGRAATKNQRSANISTVGRPVK